MYYDYSTATYVYVFGTHSDFSLHKPRICAANPGVNDQTEVQAEKACVYARLLLRGSKFAVCRLGTAYNVCLRNPRIVARSEDPRLRKKIRGWHESVIRT